MDVSIVPVNCHCHVVRGEGAHQLFPGHFLPEPEAAAVVVVPFLVVVGAWVVVGALVVVVVGALVVVVVPFLPDSVVVVVGALVVVVVASLVVVVAGALVVVVVASLVVVVVGALVVVVCLGDSVVVVVFLGALVVVVCLGASVVVVCLEEVGFLVGLLVAAAVGGTESLSEQVAVHTTFVPFLALYLKVREAPAAIPPSRTTCSGKTRPSWFCSKPETLRTAESEVSKTFAAASEPTLLIVPVYTLYFS